MKALTMRIFNNIKHLNNYILRHNKHVIYEVAKAIENDMKEFIVKELYQKYTPKEYARTYDYINSLTLSRVKEIDGGHEIEIYFDPDKIRANYVTDRRWNQHMSVDGFDFSEDLPYAIEYGVTGSLYDRDGIGVVEETIEILKSGRLHELVKKKYKSFGFDIA